MICDVCAGPEEGMNACACGRIRRNDNNVVFLNIATRHDIPAERVLRAALDAGLARCVVLGHLPTTDGVPAGDGEEYMTSSIADGADVVWLLERCKHRLMSIAGD